MKRSCFFIEKGSVHIASGDRLNPLDIGMYNMLVQALLSVRISLSSGSMPTIFDIQDDLP